MVGGLGAGKGMGMGLRRELVGRRVVLGLMGEVAHLPMGLGLVGLLCITVSR
jgi:hypothetical protein